MHLASYIVTSVSATHAWGQETSNIIANDGLIPITGSDDLDNLGHFAWVTCNGYLGDNVTSLLVVTYIIRTYRHL